VRTAATKHPSIARWTNYEDFTFADGRVAKAWVTWSQDIDSSGNRRGERRCIRVGDVPPLCACSHGEMRHVGRCYAPGCRCEFFEEGHS